MFDGVDGFCLQVNYFYFVLKDIQDYNFTIIEQPEGIYGLRVVLLPKNSAIRAKMNQLLLIVRSLRAGDQDKAAIVTGAYRQYLSHWVLKCNLIFFAVEKHGSIDVK